MPGFVPPIVRLHWEDFLDATWLPPAVLGEILFALSERLVNRDNGCVRQRT